MDFSTLFDFLDPHTLDYTWLKLPLDGVYHLAWGLIVASGVLCVLTMGVWAINTLKHRKAQKRRRSWEALLKALQQSRSPVSAQLTALGKQAIRQHAEAFITVWIEKAEKALRVSELDAYSLSVLLQQAELYPILTRWIEQPNLYRRMLAIRVFGLVVPVYPKVWYQVFHRLQSKNPAESLNAAYTLFHINPTRALPAILEMYCKRLDWADSKVSSLLFFSHATDHTPQVLEAIHKQLQVSSRLQERYTRKLLGLLRFHSNVGIARFLYDQLTWCQHHKQPYQLPEAQDRTLLVLDALTTMENIPDISLVAPYLDHIDWRYRLKAVRILGDHSRREEDTQRLRRALNDPEWWVAFRATEALQRRQRLDEDKMLLSRRLHLVQ